MDEDRKPLVSIITITYNAADVLPATMISVGQQTMVDFEHIIVDGASSDDTLSVARKLASPALRILSEPDEGIYDAMNKGMRLARGEYLIFLNAGDAFHSSDTLAAYAEAARRTGCDIVYGDTIIVDSARRPLRPRHLSAPQILTKRSLRQGMLICHQALMVARRIAPEYDTAYRFSADYDWEIRCVASSAPERSVNLGMITIDYLDAGATERNKIRSLRERFRIMARHYGLAGAIRAHLSFIPRVLRRHLH